LAILKAHFSFYSFVALHFKKRDVFQSEKYYKIKSIVFQYFAKAGKVFVK
jgi:hypothetical protein